MPASGRIGARSDPRFVVHVRLDHEARPDPFSSRREGFQVRTDLRCANNAAPPCAVTFGEVFSMQPFGNSLVVMTLSGAQLRQMLEDQQRPGRPAPVLLIPSALLTYRWVAKAEHGQRVQDLKLAGVPIDPAADYRFTVNSFLADGGDGFVMLREGRNRLGGDIDLDALIAHLKSNPSPDPVPRITWVE